VENAGTHGALIAGMKFGNLFIMNITILAGSLLTLGTVSADPIAANVTVIDTVVTKTPDGMSYDHIHEYGSNFGNVSSADDSEVVISLADGRAMPADSGEVLLPPGVHSETQIAFKNINGNFNPGVRAIDAGNPLQAKALIKLATDRDVTISINNKCTEKNKDCGKRITINNFDGSTSTIMNYTLEQVTITIQGTTETLNKYFAENGPTKEALKSLDEFTGNRSPSHDSHMADFTIKQNFGPVTADLSSVPVLGHSNNPNQNL
jgi:hypothetical protein